MEPLVAQDEDLLKKQAVVLDPLTQTAAEPEQPKEAEAAPPVQAADVSQGSEGPRFVVNSLQDRDQFVQDQAIPVSLDIEGKPGDLVSVRYEAYYPELGQSVTLSQGAQLDGSGRAQARWAFQSQMSGPCVLRMVVQDSTGKIMTQEVKLDILGVEAEEVEADPLPVQTPKEPEEKKRADDEAVDAEELAQVRAEAQKKQEDVAAG